MIYLYYLNHINLWGHSKGAGGFYTVYGTYIYHAHNMFLQIAYAYGVFTGILFLLLVVYGVLHLFAGAVKSTDGHKWICLVFFIAIVFYGMTEMAVNPETISWGL